MKNGTTITASDRPIQGYVLGFMFDNARERLALIRKKRPTWQAGLLNGIGGKIESGEEPDQAMQREFQEESGLLLQDWEPCVLLRYPFARIHVYRSFHDGHDQLRTLTDEPIEIVHPNFLPSDTIANLRWLVPLAMDPDLSRSLTLESPGTGIPEGPALPQGHRLWAQTSLNAADFPDTGSPDRMRDGND